MGTASCIFITGFNGCLHRLLPFRHNQWKCTCRWLSLSTWRTRWHNMTITSECGHPLGTCQLEPTLALGNDKCCVPSCYTFSLKYGRNEIGFTSPTNPAQPRECFMSLCVEGMRRETSFYIKKGPSRQRLSAEECGQACFIAGHWGQQPSSTICV